MRRTSGFSLMEMMVVLLIVAIIAAASAPMVSRKMAADGSGSGFSDCGWENLENNTVFNRDGNQKRSVIIGAKETDMAEDKSQPRLFISTKSKDNPQILLRDSTNKAFDKLNIAFFKASTWLSTKPVPDVEGATAVGYEASAYNNAAALGYKANALGVNSVAIGREVTAYSDSVMIGNSGVGNKDFDSINLIAIGSGAQNISNSNAIMIGTASDSKKYLKAGQGAVAIGSQMSIDKDVLEGAQAGFASVAIGTGSSASTNSVAIGLDAKTKDGNNLIYHSIAIGPLSEVKSNLGTALGYQAKLENSSSNAVALGASATIGVSAENAIAIGYNSKALLAAENAIAIGANATADKQDSIAIGYGTVASNNSICIGYSAKSANNVTSTDSIAIGVNAKAASESIAIGTYDSTWTETSANATGYSSIAIGQAVEASGQSSIAIGTGSALSSLTNASATNAIAIGSGAVATANDSIALMHNAEATGEYSIAIGKMAMTHKFNGKETPSNAIAIGYQARAPFDYSTAIGSGAEATASNQIVLGNKDTVVYIPGNLVVDKTTVLARNAASNGVYLAVDERDDKTGTNVLRLLQTPEKNSSENGTLKVYGDNNPTRYPVDDDYPLGISDRRLKNVGEVFKGGLDEIKKLEVFNYTYKKDKDKTPRVGVMAQDLQKIFPNAVVKGDDGFLRIRMEDMFYALVNAVKELDRKIDLLIEKQKKIDELEKRVDTLEKRLAKLEKQMKEK